jgi:hypothetical protein
MSNIREISVQRISSLNDLTSKKIKSRFDVVRPQRSNYYLIGYKGQLYSVWPDACFTSQYDCIGNDERTTDLIISDLIKRGITGTELVRMAILDTASLVHGVACDPEGPILLSIK